MALGCWAAFALSDDEALRSVANECVALCRSRGAFQVLPEALNYLGQWALRTGSLTAADEYFTECEAIQSVSHRKGTDEPERLIVSAWRGREADVRAAASRSPRARDFGLGLVVDLAEYALALLELGLGNYRAAAECRPNFAPDLALGPFRAVDAIEAHARGGDHEAAVAALEWLSGRALANGSSIDLGLAARGRALLSDDADAEEHYREALAQLGRAEPCCTSRGPSCSTASGSDAGTGAATPVFNSQPRSRRSNRPAPTRSPTGRGSSSSPRA